MKTNVLFFCLFVIVAIASCSKKDDNGTTDNNGSGNYTSADLVGQWSGTCVKGSGTTTLNFSCNDTLLLSGEGLNSEGRLTVRGKWSITSAGKVTGGGYYGYFYGSSYSNAWADWDLQLSENKNTLTGTLDCAVSPFFDAAVVSLTKQ
jgi:hypothetical protein